MITVNFVIYNGDGVWMLHQIVSGNAMCLLYHWQQTDHAVLTIRYDNNMAKQFITMLC